jgi:DNA topoisomerase-1
LPELVSGEHLDCQKFDPEQHFTKPPARYSEATLVKALEENGIGRPSTYAPIIKTIQDRNYVEKLDKRFFPTALGKTVNEVLMKFFAKVMDIEFTAQMENILDEIEIGDKNWVKVLQEFYGPFSISLKDVEDKIGDIKKEFIETDEICELCGSKMYLKTSRYGQFFACSKFPECKFTKNIVKKSDEARMEGQKDVQIDVSNINEVCEKCGSKMVLKKGRFGSFLACEKYPECKTTKSLDTLRHIKCPKEGCTGELIRRWSRKTRKYFYGCSKYPECNYITNNVDDLEKKEGA